MSILMEVIEWLDPTGEEMIYRIPQEGSSLCLSSCRRPGSAASRNDQAASGERSGQKGPAPRGTTAGIRENLTSSACSPGTQVR